jgi:hypothetical protein
MYFANYEKFIIQDVLFGWNFVSFNGKQDQFQGLMIHEMMKNFSSHQDDNN